MQDPNRPLANHLASKLTARLGRATHFQGVNRLIYRGIQKHRENRWRWPLIVIETLVAGSAKSNPE